MANVITPRSNTFNVLQANTDRRPSKQIWSESPWIEIKDLRSKEDGVSFYDEFEDFPVPGTQTAQIQMGRWKIFGDTAGIVRPSGFPANATTPTSDTNYPGGVVALIPSGAAKMACMGLSTSAFNLTTTNLGKLRFEARIATTSILTNMGQIFVGLAETQRMTFAVGTPLAATDATGTGGAMIGFNRLEDGLAVLNTSYADRAATWTNIQAAAYSSLAANTFVKLGMVFDPANSARCIRFFVNGVECSTAMTKAALLALTSLDVGMLAPCVAFIADSAGAAAIVYVDWVGCEQQF